MPGIQLKRTTEAAAATPDADHVNLFHDDDTDEPAYKDSGGTVHPLVGATGADGAPGAAGADGADGAPGADGADGQGVPVGGTASQRLAKIDGTDFNTEWVDPSDTGVSLTGDTGSTTGTTDITFSGADVTDDGGGAATVTITGGGGGGATIQRPALTPATPLDDFDGASLDGAWSAHSSQGSFATGHVITQAIDGSFLSMGYSGQMGALIRSTTNVDQEFIAGGFRMRGGVTRGIAVMPGIAILDTNGTGVAVITYNDSNAYLADIVTWNYNANYGLIEGFGVNMGHNVSPDDDYWLRLTRVGNTWDGYISYSGRLWDAHSSATGSKTITAAYLAIGLFYNTAITYMGRIECDWVHKV